MEEIMKNNIFAVLLTFIFGAGIVIAADDPGNIAGYGKTVWGMTPDEVVIAEKPRAEKLEKTEKFKNGLGMVTIKEIQIGITKFSAIFIFDESGQKLYQVNLTGAEKKNAAINAQSFASIEKLLTEKYGSPTYKDGTRNVSWKLAKTTIELTHMHMPDIISKLIISYKPATASEDAAKDL